MHHGHMHRGEKSYLVCGDRSNHALQISSILSWHSTLMAQGRLTVMQDLAGHEPNA